MALDIAVSVEIQAPKDYAGVVRESLRLAVSNSETDLNIPVFGWIRNEE